MNRNRVRHEHPKANDVYTSVHISIGIWGLKGVKQEPQPLVEEVNTVNFAFTEEQEELRSFIRSFMEEKSAEATVRELMETDDGYDAAVWSQMAEQLGLQSMIIPEEYGGQGFGYVELGIALEEMGRSLLCAPFFSTVVLAGNAIIHSGNDEAKAALLPGIADGSTIATLALAEANGRWDA
ncbi:MAG TPA: hypothetical protein DCL16_05395, partial [Acidimicrobiaceae bacterium]|nr:hypothetical protein [Acidimicrobiaceae bacterium]